MLRQNLNIKVGGSNQNNEHKNTKTLCKTQEFVNNSLRINHCEQFVSLYILHVMYPNID